MASRPYRWSLIADSAETTHGIGRNIGRLAYSGLVIALTGDLGAGKTCLSQGVARGLGIPEEVPVPSPTFTLINPYDARLPLYHVDFYRLGDAEELEVLGFRDLFKPGVVSCIEWADRFPDVFPEEYLTVSLAFLSPSERKVVFEAVGEGENEVILIEQLKQLYAEDRVK